MSTLSSFAVFLIFLFPCLYIVADVGLWTQLTSVVFVALLSWFVSDVVVPVGVVAGEGRAVLVTGCDTGFGHEVAKRLHDLGFTVFAGCLFKDSGGEGARDLAAITSPRLHVVQMDVTSDDSVWKVRQYVEAHLSDATSGLWAILNNAGTSTYGLVEWCPIETYKRVAEVNLWGTVRVTKVFLPLVRKSQGRVINIASILGRSCVPSRSAYGITKYGVESFSDVLRYEMKRWGVDVSIIEPGNFISATNIFTEDSIENTAMELWDGMTDEVKEAYGKKALDDYKLLMHKFATKGSRDTSPVVDTMVAAVVAVKPKTRYQVMQPYWHIRTFIMTHLPEWIADNIYIY
ncbi:D-beta-hydroxybutyrate dehydrogenase, mitochondrial-like [Branchiostoma lanceolatum]|uniref:D-beta-hydroxybutyrate dehydrogenase, mitochondrial-like n=1 Tax=Branchiostoma lanceolatum TaxID=7740 RepID=UPI0034521CC4